MNELIFILIWFQKSDPLCRDTTQSHIDSAAIIDQNVFLFVGDLVYESTIDENNNILRVAKKPEEIASKWKSNTEQIERNLNIKAALCYRQKNLKFIVLYQVRNKFCIH
jgi:hypothetical protein